MTREQKQKASFFALASLALGLCFSVAMQAQQPASPTPLTEVERLKGENLQLKLDSADKQMRLLQEQYTRLAELQAALVRQLQQLEQEILTARGLPPADWTVNWQAKQIEKPEGRSQKSEGKP